MLGANYPGQIYPGQNYLDYGVEQKHKEITRGGGIPSEIGKKFYRYYKGKIYTIQEAARRRKLDSQEELEAEARVQEELVAASLAIESIAKEAEETKESEELSRERLKERIESVARDLAIIKRVRHSVEADIYLKRLEAENLLQHERLAVRTLQRLKEEEEKAIAITLLMLV